MELSILELHDENMAPDYHPLRDNENMRAPHEYKVLDLNQYIRCHDKQIQRLQRDQSKRIEDYVLLRNQLESDTSGLQKQIDVMRNELQRMHERTAQVQEMRKRLAFCEDQSLQMQIHNDSEFEALRNVMERVCDRIDRMEELQQAEREHMLHQQQQQQQQHGMRASIIQSPNHPSAAQGAGAGGIRPRRTSPRVECPHCSKDLSKAYLKAHIKLNRCKCMTPYSIPQAQGSLTPY